MDALPNQPFSMVPLPSERQRKPRGSGLTMMIDWGLPYQRVRDQLETVAPYIDLVKIAVGTARLYQEEQLVKKLALYKSHGVRPFLGGQFGEYVFATQGQRAMEPFYAEAKRVGFDAVEVSDNCVPLGEAEREHLIRKAIGSGLEVHGEVGSKLEQQSASTLIAQANLCLDAGCHVVLVEGAELVEGGRPKRELIRALREELDLSKVLLELTGPWIEGAGLAEVYRLKKFLIGEFGANVNLANVMPDDVLETEALRVGLSVIGPKREAGEAR